MASLLSLDNVPAEMKKRLKWKPFKGSIVSDSELHFYLDLLSRSSLLQGSADLQRLWSTYATVLGLFCKLDYLPATDGSFSRFWVSESNTRISQYYLKRKLSKWPSLWS